MTKKKYQRYSSEFKRLALKRPSEDGVTDKKVHEQRILGAADAYGIAEKDATFVARPYLFEVHPDEGYPSLYFNLYDLFACCDGINSEGFVVAMLADDESANRYPGPPVTKVGLGLHPLQTTRLLLDTCATAEEAKRQLLRTKTYAFMIPCHFLVADRHGNSFVWEWSFRQRQCNPGALSVCWTNTTGLRKHTCYSAMTGA